MKKIKRDITNELLYPHVCDDGKRSVRVSLRETRIQSLSDFTLEFLCIARNHLTRIAGYLRKVMTKLCIKILVKADSAIEAAFPLVQVLQ